MMRNFKVGDKVRLKPSSYNLCPKLGKQAVLTVKRVKDSGRFYTEECIHQHAYSYWELMPYKVTVEQIREFVARKADRVDVGPANPKREFSVYVKLRDVLDFIDNGPKKPTAEEIADEAYRKWARDQPRGYRYEDPARGQAVVKALREAGYLKEDV